MSDFTFTEKNLEKVKQILAKYPSDRKASAVMPLLMLAQDQTEGQFVSVEAMDYIAKMLEMPKIKVYEVANFYTMYNTEKIGKYHIQVCSNISCFLRGADAIYEHIQKHLELEKKGQTTKDGLFTLSKVECLGACVNAPVVQINKDYHENIDSYQKAISLIENLKK